MPDPLPSDSGAGTAPANLGTVKDSDHSFRIILAGFGIVGSLAALFVLHPEAIAENVVTGVIGGILGFLAGRKK